MVYTGNWVIIYHLPPIKGTRNSYWTSFTILILSCHQEPRIASPICNSIIQTTRKTSVVWVETNKTTARATTKYWLVNVLWQSLCYKWLFRWGNIKTDMMSPLPIRTGPGKRGVGRLLSFWGRFFPIWGYFFSKELIQIETNPQMLVQQLYSPLKNETYKADL